MATTEFLGGSCDKDNWQPNVQFHFFPLKIRVSEKVGFKTI